MTAYGLVQLGGMLPYAKGQIPGKTAGLFRALAFRFHITRHGGKGRLQGSHIKDWAEMPAV